MLYISKGIVQTKHADQVYINHGGKIFRLTGAIAHLWIKGHKKPNNTKCEGLLQALISLDLAESADELYWLLTRCIICPAKVKLRDIFLNRQDRHILFWIRNAGMRLTVSELIWLMENNIPHLPMLCGVQNRQALTETIYNEITIMDEALDYEMSTATAKQTTVDTILRLLEKGKLVLL